ncbi:MAG: transporter family-2 protein [Pseudohongiellaceae bacterium]|jgi:transporter family-2 protein
MSYFPQHPGFYSALMLLAGIGIPIMAALNAGLGSRLANPAYSAVILFSVGLLASTAYLLIAQGIPSSLPPPGIPVHFYLGGLFVLFYVLSITWVAPRFGIGNAVSFVLLGQLLSMAAIDHFALMGANHHPFTLQRFIGLVLMASGVFLVVRK